MKPMKFGVGQGVKRVEDFRLVSGRGNYTSDASQGAELRAVFLRSPYGHARFRIEDLEAARAAPGVRGVFVASDFSNLGPLPCLATVPNSDKSKTPLKPYPVMAENEADHVGDIVAMVVADTTLQGRDAAELIGVAWEELPAVVDMEEAIRPGRRWSSPARPATSPMTIISATSRKPTPRSRERARTVRDQNRQPARGRQLHGAARARSGSTIRSPAASRSTSGARASTPFGMSWPTKF